MILGFNSTQGQFCTWTYDYNTVHISSVTSTKIQDVLLISINDYSDNARTVGYNLSNSSFIKKNNLTSIFFDPLQGFSDYTNSYSTDIYLTKNNDSIWNLSTKTGMKIFEKKINVSFTEIGMFFVSQEFNMIYLLVINDRSNEKTLLTTQLDNTSAVSYSDFLPRGYYYPQLNLNNVLKINQEEHLLYSAPGCCYCGLGDYFTYNETTLMQVISANSIARFNLYDPRSNEFIEVLFGGNITVYNYDQNTIKDYTINLKDIDNFLSNNQIIGFDIGIFLIPVVMVAFLMVLFRGKNFKHR